MRARRRRAGGRGAARRLGERAREKFAFRGCGIGGGHDIGERQPAPGQGPALQGPALDPDEQRTTPAPGRSTPNVIANPTIAAPRIQAPSASHSRLNSSQSGANTKPQAANPSLRTFARSNAAAGLPTSAGE